MQATIRKTQSSLDPFSIALSVMDACWLYVVAWIFSAVLLGRIAPFSVPQPVLLALLEFGGLFLAADLVRRGRFESLLSRVGVALLGLALAALVAFTHVPLSFTAFNVVYFVPFFYLLFLSLGVWLLGTYRAAQPDSYERAYSHFRLGLGIIALAIFLATTAYGGNISGLWEQLWGAVFAFFGAGLAALALGNRDTVRREAGGVGLHSWGHLLAVSVGAVLLLGMIAQVLGAGDIVSTIRGGVTAVLMLVGGILFSLTALIVWPLSLCNITFDFNSARTPTPTPTPQPSRPNPLEEFQRQNEGYNPLNVPVEWQALFMGLAGLLIVAVILYVVMRAMRVGRNRRPVDVEEVHERFGSWSLLVSQARALLDRFFNRFRKSALVPTAAVVDDLAPLRGRPDMAATLTVRQLYARLLEEARRAGYPRVPHQTPNEYLRVFSKARPDLTPQLETITAAYLEARYSPNPVSSLTASSANDAWRRVETALNPPRQGDADAQRKGRSAERP